MKRSIGTKLAILVAVSLAVSGCFGDSDPASSITKTTAVLNAHCATLSDSSSSSITYFEYGTTTAYGMKTPTRSWAAGLCAGFNETIGGLTPNTVYHFRVCGKELSLNGLPACSADRTFTTLKGSTTVTPAITLDGGIKNKKATTPVTSMTATGVATTGPNHVLVAFVSWEGPPSSHDTITVSGGGLSWTRRVQAAIQEGNAEIWTATSPSPLASSAITASRTGGAYEGMLSVIATQGTTGVGAVQSANGTVEPQSLVITTTSPSSWVVAVGEDADQGVTHTATSGQAKMSESVVAGVGDFWTQKDVNVPLGNLTMHTTGPTGSGRWNYAAVELKLDSQAPTCSISNLAADAEVRGTITVNVSSTDNVATTGVELLSDCETSLGTASGGGPNFPLSLGTLNFGDGPLTIFPRCSDDAGNVTDGAPVRIWISNRRGSVMGLNAGATDPAEVDAVAGTDVRWIRDGSFEWQWMAQTQSEYNQGLWAYLDGQRGGANFQAMADYVHSRGLRLLEVAMGSPAWVSGAQGVCGSGGDCLAHPAPLPSMTGYFAGYVHELCKRGADAVEVWNEPNTPGAFWSPSQANIWKDPANWPRNYAKTLREAYTAVKSDPQTAHCQIITAGLAPYGHEQISGVHHPVNYLVAAYNAKLNDSDTSATLTIKGFFDGLAHHPYADYHNGYSPKDWYPYDPFGFQTDPYRNSVYWHGFEQTWRLRLVMAFVGDGNLPIWGTELGAATQAAANSTYWYNAACGGGCGITEAQQATWVDEYVDAWMSTAAVPGSACGGTCSSDTPPNYFGSFTGPLIYFAREDSATAATGDGPVCAVAGDTTTISPQASCNNSERHFGLQHADATAKPGYTTFVNAADQLRP